MAVWLTEVDVVNDVKSATEPSTSYRRPQLTSLEIECLLARFGDRLLGLGFASRTREIERTITGGRSVAHELSLAAGIVLHGIEMTKTPEVAEAVVDAEKVNGASKETPLSSATNLSDVDNESCQWTAIDLDDAVRICTENAAAGFSLAPKRTSSSARRQLTLFKVVLGCSPRTGYTSSIAAAQDCPEARPADRNDPYGRWYDLQRGLQLTGLGDHRLERFVDRSSVDEEWERLFAGTALDKMYGPGPAAAAGVPTAESSTIMSTNAAGHGAGATGIGGAATAGAAASMTIQVIPDGGPLQGLPNKSHGWPIRGVCTIKDANMTCQQVGAVAYHWLEPTDCELRQLLHPPRLTDSRPDSGPRRRRGMEGGDLYLWDGVCGAETLPDPDDRKITCGIVQVPERHKMVKAARARETT